MKKKLVFHDNDEKMDRLQWSVSVGDSSACQVFTLPVFVDSPKNRSGCSGLANCSTHMGDVTKRQPI
ncbi:MAG: hypothetical protein DWH82_09770 [Planctomycetota bacterium]|nr:MAG: hypothetical protein DWH82_09770 [Planctomycetota bacterium]